MPLNICLVTSYHVIYKENHKRSYLKNFLNPAVLQLYYYHHDQNKFYFQFSRHNEHYFHVQCSKNILGVWHHSNLESVLWSVPGYLVSCIYDWCKTSSKEIMIVTGNNINLMSVTHQTRVNNQQNDGSPTWQ